MDSVFCGRHICWIRTKAQSTINYSYLPRWRNWKYFITVVRCTLTKCWYAASAGSPVCWSDLDLSTNDSCMLYSYEGGGGIWPPHSWPLSVSLDLRTRDTWNGWPRHSCPLSVSLEPKYSSVWLPAAALPPLSCRHLAIASTASLQLKEFSMLLSLSIFCKMQFSYFLSNPGGCWFASKASLCLVT